MKKFIFVLILISFLNFLFALRTNNYFSVDDFAVLSYLKNHNVLQMSFDFLINGDVFGFRKLTGFVFFGFLFKTFGTNNYAFDAFMFLTNTINLIILFLIVKKLTKNDFAAFFVSLIFNKNYLFYYSNIHEHLLALFCFLTIYLFITYPKKFYLSVISFILALFTKETAFTVPLILLAISFFKKLDRRKIYYLLGISILYGIYASYFFITQKILTPNFSYTVASKATDIFNGLLYFVGAKVLLLLFILPILIKKYKYLPLFLVALITLLPASILVNRREMYYIYMPFGYLLIYLSMFLPKLNIKTFIIYIIIFVIFGGKSILPKVAWNTFPNWQKVSMENVISRVDENIINNPEIKNIDISDINLERDAILMLDSGTIDLFLDKSIASRYSFVYQKNDNTFEVEKR